MEVPSGRPTPEACVAGFRLWFWGIPFWFDLPVFGFDALPDIIGFGFIVLGTSVFGRFHQLLPRIQLLAGILGALSILTVYRPAQLGAGYEALAVVVGIIFAAVHALLVWWMCQVVADFARRVHELDTVKSAELRRLLFVGYSVAVAVILALEYTNQTEDYGPMILGILFASVAVLGLLMELMMQARQLCGGKQPEMVPVAAPDGAPMEARVPA